MASRMAARRRTRRVIVLMYHAIGHSAYAVHPDVFEAQMDYLHTHAKVVGLDEIVSESTCSTPSRLTCAITFDDGYAGVHEYAYPILQRYRFPAVVYVTTSALDRSDGNKSEPIPGFFPSEPTLSWAATREMSDGGITIGSHLCHHLNMAKLSLEVAAQELNRSKEIISQRLSAPCSHFAYPSGLYSEKTVDCVRTAGYRSAVTVRHSVVPDEIDLFRIPRMGLGPMNSWADFEGMLSGDLDYLLITRAIWRTLRLNV